jgi:molecular chaperone GrpE
MNDHNNEEVDLAGPPAQVELPRVEVVQEEASPGNETENTEVKESHIDTNLSANLEDFTEQLREINRISEERERIIDRLHDDNQKLKQGELQQVLLPVFRDLIRLSDDLKITAANYADREGTEKVANEFTCYRETVGDILYRYGVEQIEVAAGESFNPKEHKAVASSPAAGPEQDRTIAKIVRDGFKTEFRVIRNAEVEVYRHDASGTSTVEQPQPASKVESESLEAK